MALAKWSHLVKVASETRTCWDLGLKLVLLTLMVSSHCRVLLACIMCLSRKHPHHLRYYMEIIITSIGFYQIKTLPAEVIHAFIPSSLLRERQRTM